MIYATKDDINRCKTIVQNALRKAGQVLDDDAKDNKIINYEQ
jgi:hypothetical protein